MMIIANNDDNFSRRNFPNMGEDLLNIEEKFSV